MLDQPHPVIITEVHAGELERRLVAALREWTCVMVERDQSQETLQEMFLHADIGAQRTVKAFHGARRSYYLIERFTDLALHFAKVLDAAAPMPETAQRRQIGALPAPGLMSLGAVMPGAGHGVESCPAKGRPTPAAARE